MNVSYKRELQVMDVSISNAPPTLEEFVDLRAEVGWGQTPANLVQTALNNSLFHIVARDNKELVGMARIVGDGAMFFYIQDLIVSPRYQRKGIGDLLMQGIECYLSEVAKSGSTVGLLSAAGKEAYYARYGYKLRSGAPLGFGMCKFM